MGSEDVVDAAGPTVVDALFEDAWNNGRFAPLRRRTAGAVTFHYRGTTFTTSVDELETLVGHWRAAFPDLRLDVRAVVAQGDLVAVRLRYTGTHLGTWQDTPPSGRSIEVDEMVFLRLDDGLLVEVWEVQDELALLVAIGAVDLPDD